jgi:hypothetical protein
MFTSLSWYLTWIAKNRNLGPSQRFLTLFIYCCLFRSLKSLKEYCLRLSLQQERLASSCFAAIQFAVITLQIKGTRKTPTFYHTNKGKFVAVIKYRRDQMSQRQNVGVIICRCDQTSVIYCRFITCHGFFSQNLSLIPPSIMSVAPEQKYRFPCVFEKYFSCVQPVTF